MVKLPYTVHFNFYVFTGSISTAHTEPQGNSCCNIVAPTAAVIATVAVVLVLMTIRGQIGFVNVLNIFRTIHPLSEKQYERKE